MSNTWTVEIETDELTGELMLLLPDEVVKHLAVEPGDLLDWVDNGNGSWVISKKVVLEEAIDTDVGC